MRNRVFGMTTSKAVLLLGLVLVMVIAVGGAIAVWMLRAQAIDEWRGQMRNYSLVLASHTTQTFASANLVLDGVSQRIQLAGVTNEAGLRAKTKTAEFHQMMRDRAASSPFIDVVTVVAENGDVINFTRSFPAPPCASRVRSPSSRTWATARVTRVSTTTKTNGSATVREMACWRRCPES